MQKFIRDVLKEKVWSEATLFCLDAIYYYIVFHALFCHVCLVKLELTGARSEVL